MPQEGMRQRRVSSYDDGYRSQERHDGRNISGKTVQGSASTRRRVLRADAPTLLDHGVRPCRTRQHSISDRYSRTVARLGHCLSKTRLLPLWEKVDAMRSIAAG